MNRNFRYWKWLQWSNHAYMERYHQCTLKCHSNKMDQQKKNISSTKSGFIKQRLILGLKIKRLLWTKHVRWLTHPCLQGQVWPRLGHSRVHVADPHPCLVAEVAEVSLNIGDAPIGKSWIHQWITGLWYTYPSEKIWVRQLGILFPIYGKIKNVPNHQPD